uniref:Uncharacterized protein n=1 Tax=Lactuca sativa TaxID=4236 RepID=A0A9R1WN27_LACSA|nr:hypothetical protein LSAT_V11C100037950 [Lactuca sativa]
MGVGSNENTKKVENARTNKLTKVLKIKNPESLRSQRLQSSTFLLEVQNDEQNFEHADWEILGFLKIASLITLYFELINTIFTFDSFLNDENSLQVLCCETSHFLVIWWLIGSADKASVFTSKDGIRASESAIPSFGDSICKGMIS